MVGLGIVIRVGITRGRDEKYVLFCGANNRIIKRLGISSATPRIAGRDDIQSVTDLQVGNVVDCQNGISGCPAARSQEFSGDEFHIPVDTRDSDAVPAYCS